VFTVLAAVAELERSLIGERVKAGIRNADSFKRKRGSGFKQKNDLYFLLRLTEEAT